MAKIMVTGANGQLGSELRFLGESNTHDFVFTDIQELDITNEADVLKFVTEVKPNYIINCAAYTAVDNAETHVEKARALNAMAAGFLAEAARSVGARLIQVSTDYVFDGSGSQPYTERKFTIPTGMYGKTKLEGEEFVYEVGGEYLIIRTSWLYSTYGNNFVKTMLRLGRERGELGVIYDQIGTPTYARDLAQAMLTIIENVDAGKIPFKRGIYHYSNEGVASWYDFAKAIMEFAGVDCKVNPILTEAYPTPAKRPHYSLLAKEKIRKVYEIEVPYWRDSLKACIAALETN